MRFAWEPQDFSEDDFKFGLGPILDWFSIIGISLKKNRPGKRKFLCRLYEVGLLLSTFLILIIFILDDRKKSNSKDSETVVMRKKQATSTSTIVRSLDFVFYYSQGIGLQYLLFFQTKTQWNDLWCSLQNLRRFASPKSETKCRKLIIIGLIYLITSVELSYSHSHSLRHWSWNILFS